MTAYRFETALRVTASAEAVYGAIVDPAWVGEWGDATSVERERDGDDTGLGARYAATVRAPVGYQLSARIETVEARPWHHLRMTATGSVEGAGVWDLEEGEGYTDVTFTWQVRTTERWMNLLAPVARPLFERSHGIVMRHAAETAARHLGADLLAFRSRPLRPQEHP